jgi:hypothetical protein
LTAPLDEMPFPSLFAVLVLANFAYQRERVV